MKRVVFLLMLALPLFAQTHEAYVGVEVEDLPGDQWQQIHVALQLGPIGARVAHAERGDASDEQFEVEAYPRFAPKTYAYLAAGMASDGTLYPDWRAAAELYHGFAGNLEASAGIRHLAFDDEVDVYTASLGMYAGNWLFIGRGYRARGNNSWQASARRYFGDAGSYLGARLGTVRDEIRSGADLVSLDHNEAVVEGVYVAPSRWTLRGRAGASDDGLLAAVALGRRF